MAPSIPATAAGLLAEARRARRLISSFPAEMVPVSMAAAYALQDEIRSLLGHPLAGWKTGATAAAVQARFGVTEPFTGPILAPDVFETPASLAAADFPHRMVESEFAFRFGRSLRPRAEPYTREEVLEAVDAVIPAIELVGPRLVEMPFDRAALAVADGGVNMALVLGQPVSGFAASRLPDHPVRLLVDGVTRAEGSGRAVLGDPIASLVWTVGHLGKRGITVEAGHVISTGTTTGIVMLEPHQTALADFGALGTVELRFV